MQETYVARSAAVQHKRLGSLGSTTIGYQYLSLRDVLGDASVEAILSFEGDLLPVIRTDDSHLCVLISPNNISHRAANLGHCIPSSFGGGSQPSD